MARTIAITGASGMVGTQLSSTLTTRGDRVIPLKRGAIQPEGTDLYWDPDGDGICQPQAAAGIDTVVHLAGENIASGRWSVAQKGRIRSSRISATKNLVRSLGNMDQPPSTLVCASAIGIYGNRGSEKLTESSPRGTGFLADVCADWEAAAAEAEQFGIRVVQVRIGVVLSPLGGALAKMLTPFRLGAGGIVGDGKQYWSWIGLHDLVRVLVEAVDNEALCGPVNAVSPHSMTNRDFTKSLGAVLHRPTIFPLPGFVAKILLGEMAEELLLSSARVMPDVLSQHGFQFEHGDLENCLRHELNLTS
jgi:uncharacterized protein